MPIADHTEPYHNSRKRVVLIGPVLPYRGGIAHHGTMLYKTLRGKSTTKTISFSRLYPQWLFPGESDREPLQEDNLEPGVEYLIDSINPISWWQAAQQIRLFKPDLIVLPWWHVYWAICYYSLILLLRKSGAQIVVVCHNAVEHEDAKWKHFLRNAVLAKANRFIVHSAVDKENLQLLFPDKNCTIHPLPIYEQFPRVESLLPKRAKLELLFFGFVRPYKGLSVLLEAMTKAREEDVFLSIVGEFWDGYEAACDYIRLNKLEGNVELVNRYVSDQEAATFFERCDAVVLPYISATGSGIVNLAYHYDKPVIASRTGGIPDVVMPGRTGLLVDPGDSEQLAVAIRDAAAEITFFQPQAMAKMKARLAWDSYADAVLNGQ